MAEVWPQVSVTVNSVTDKPAASPSVCHHGKEASTADTLDVQVFFFFSKCPIHSAVIFEVQEAAENIA